MVFLRIATGTLVLLAFVRPRLRGFSWQSVGIGVAFGAILAVMNLGFYEALARLPIGIAVAIEFLGPLGVAVAASRRRLDVLWVVLAGTGIALLAPWGDAANADWVGIAFAGAAGVCWGAYILLSASVGQRFPGRPGSRSP